MKSKLCDAEMASTKHQMGPIDYTYLKLDVPYNETPQSHLELVFNFAHNNFTNDDAEF